MVDLKPFCSEDDLRQYIQQPFSFLEWSFATNGHIIVRVPRRSDITEKPTASIEASVVKLFNEHKSDDLSPVGPLSLGDPETTEEIECNDCRGRGTEHGCPDCTCSCENCDGSGKIKQIKKVYRTFRGNHFDAKYLRIISELPNIHFARKTSESNPSFFRFDGGDGLLMPCRPADAPQAETGLQP